MVMEILSKEVIFIMKPNRSEITNYSGCGGSRSSREHSR